MARGTDRAASADAEIPRLNEAPVGKANATPQRRPHPRLTAMVAAH
jgi:hypothetical protein